MRGARFASAVLFGLFGFPETIQHNHLLSRNAVCSLSVCKLQGALLSRSSSLREIAQLRAIQNLRVSSTLAVRSGALLTKALRAVYKGANERRRAGRRAFIIG